MNIYSNFFEYSLIVVAILNFILALYTILTGYKNRYIVYFSLFTFGMSLWSIGLSFFISSNSTHTAKISAQIFYIAPILISISIYLFSKAFPDNKSINMVNVLIPLILGLLISLVIILIPESLFLSISLKKYSNEILLNKPIYLIYSLFFIIYFCWGAVTLNKKRLDVNLNQKQRKQISLILYSIILAGFLGSFFNLILPGFNNYSLVWVGPQFTIIVVLAIFYGIARYQLFDIRILLGRITYVSLMALLPYIIFFITVYSNYTFFGSIFDTYSILLNFAISMLFVLVYDFVNNYLKQRVESTIINPGFDPIYAANKLNREISTILSRNSITDLVISTLAKTIRAKFEVILIENEKKKLDIFQSQTNEVDKKVLQSIFKRINKITPKIFITDLYFIDISTQNTTYKEFDLDTVNLINKNGIKIIIPIFKNGNKGLLGYLFLGNKDGDAPYETTEIDYLENIASTISVSITRSYLFEEVKDFNKNLQKEIAEATAELRSSNSQLEEALRKERDMMDILGHELRTPLGISRNSILLLEKLIESQKFTDEKVGKYIKMAVDNIRREKDLLETILQSARVEHDRVQMNDEKVIFQDVIENAREAFQDMADEKGLALNFKLPVESVEIIIDKLIIQQIVDNLISNAVKYTFEGSVTVKIEDILDSVKFSVIDTGEGISKEDLENIGKKFFRAKAQLASQGEIGGRKIQRPGGTGIGVYVIKGLLKKLNSELEITSEVSKGSTFEFTLLKTPKLRNGLKIENNDTTKK